MPGELLLKFRSEVRQEAAAALTAPQVSDVRVSAITETTAVVSWTTDIPSDSVVHYGTASYNWNVYPDTETQSALVTRHRITLSGLTQQTDYYFMVG